MMLKRPLSASPEPTNTNKNRLSTISKTCKVCGDGAYRMNYGAFTCQSCKTFFRRNGFRPELVHPCRFDGQCEVNMLTRKVCTICRLQKCFAIGMSKELIRKEDLFCKTSSSSKTESKKSQNVRCKKITPVPLLPTLNLLRNDISLLSTSDWTLFSNVIHAFDKFSLIPTLNQTLTNLSSASSQTHFNVNDALKVMGYSYISTRSFVNSAPDFQILTIGEQRSLFDRNLHGSASLCANIFFRDTNLLSNPECFASYSKLCGPEMIRQLMTHTSELDGDTTILKVMVIIMAFSSNGFMVEKDGNMYKDSLLHGTFRLFGSQNAYVEILWKYMMYRYGYEETAIRFSQLMHCLLGKMQQAAVVYVTNDIIHDFVDEVSEVSKETLNIDHNEVVPLWGKTLSSS